jgi:hypothetical protein
VPIDRLSPLHFNSYTRKSIRCRARALSNPVTLDAYVIPDDASSPSGHRYVIGITEDVLLRAKNGMLCLLSNAAPAGVSENAIHRSLTCGSSLFASLRELAPGTINLRLGAVGRLACEAADCHLLSRTRHRNSPPESRQEAGCALRGIDSQQNRAMRFDQSLTVNN